VVVVGIAEQIEPTMMMMMHGFRSRCLLLLLLVPSSPGDLHESSGYYLQPHSMPMQHCVGVRRSWEYFRHLLRRPVLFLLLLILLQRLHRLHPHHVSFVWQLVVQSWLQPCPSFLPHPCFPLQHSGRGSWLKWSSSESCEDWARWAYGRREIQLVRAH